jgi:hypothetical protein
MQNTRYAHLKLNHIAFQVNVKFLAFVEFLLPSAIANTLAVELQRATVVARNQVRFPFILWQIPANIAKHFAISTSLNSIVSTAPVTWHE